MLPTIGFFLYFLFYLLFLLFLFCIANTSKKIEQIFIKIKKLSLGGKLTRVEKVIVYNLVFSTSTQ